MLKKINEILELKNDYMRGLSNLRVSELRKITNMAHLSKAISVDDL